MSFPRRASDAQQNWMRALSTHFERVRRAHPDDELCVVFDIDGTILDMRHLVVHVLLGYHMLAGSRHFQGLVAGDIGRHEDDIEGILDDLDVRPAIRDEVLEHYRANLWRRQAVLAASRPFEGVLGVIRWFQIQPRTHVALNTGRPDRMRADTLESLNTIGAAHRVRFSPSLLFMASDGDSVCESKVANLDAIRRRGMRIVAVVDNEPENLRAMAASDTDDAMLFLHADTIFSSQRHHHHPARSVHGRDYLLRELIPERTFPDRVEFVWHGIGAAGLSDERVWFNAELPALGPEGFSVVRARHPGSTISCPVDFLVPLMATSAHATDDVLSWLQAWGVTRLSLRWGPLVRGVLDAIEARGWEVNIYGVADLEAFLDASLLLPTSVTADFNFPEWGYFGHGSGEGRPLAARSPARREPTRRPRGLARRDRSAATGRDRPNGSLAPSPSASGGP